jgi:hypothetical protein
VPVWANPKVEDDVLIAPRNQKAVYGRVEAIEAFDLWLPEEFGIQMHKDVATNADVSAMTVTLGMIFYRLPFSSRGHTHQ